MLTVCCDFMKKLAPATLAIVLCAAPGMVWSADLHWGTVAYKRGNFEGALKEWKPLAEQGDAIAQSNLGVMYYYGEGVPEDYNESARWFKLAAEQGVAVAQFGLGFMYKWGRGGVPENYDEAVRWITLAAEQGDVSAQISLGFMYKIGEGVPQDYEEAAKWIRLAAEQGHPRAEYNLGKMYEDGLGVSRDSEEAEKWKELSKEHSENQPRLLSAITTIQDTSDDTSQQDAATQSTGAEPENTAYTYESETDATAQYQNYESETGTDTAQYQNADLSTGTLAYISGNYGAALREFRPLAEQGDVEAQYYLGIMHYFGEGVPEDYEESARWFKHSAEQGNAKAQVNLAFMYEDGRGVQRDNTEAEKWFRLAAKQGHPKAQERVSAMKSENNDKPEPTPPPEVATSPPEATPQPEVTPPLEATSQPEVATSPPEATPQPEDKLKNAVAAYKSGNYGTALREFKLLAEQGDAEAQYNLGMMYYRGHGVLQNYVHAHVWANLGASNGSTPSGELRDEVTQKMTPTQVEKAQELAAECLRNNYSGC